MTGPEQAGAVARGAVVAGVCGVVSTVPVSPPVQGVLLLVLLLAGPGSAVMCWATLPAAVTVAAIVGLSVASVLATAAAMSWVPVWGPVVSCLVLSLLVIGSGVLRMRALEASSTVSESPW